MGLKGEIVRVHKELEELIEMVAETLNYQNCTIRNVAIAYGLAILAITRKVPRNDNEFCILLNKVRELFGGI